VPETYTDLRDAFNAAREKMLEQADLLDAHRSAAKPTDAEGIETYEERERELEEAWETAFAETELRETAAKNRAALDRARSQFKPITTPTQQIAVSEPDLYVRGGRSFFQDLYMSQMKNEGSATERLTKHMALEVEKRATTASSYGGLIPPAYLLDLYAKAPRNGRVYADQCNGATLPDTGMSIIVPRITTASAAGMQTENSAATTQDPAETDLTVNVRTIAGYLPVSRQALERAAYDDQILFEDLTARYWAMLDLGCLNGLGSGVTILGVLNTSNISASTASTATVAGIYPKIADVIQQINVAMGGIGYTADKIIMHPRRWGMFNAAVDTTGRPIFGITGQNYFNDVGVGDAAGYGSVGSMLGLPVYTDANIPTTLGAGTNQDAIIVHASPVVHLWERSGDPVTLSFEQQAGTSLQVQLICFGYVAFTAGRYPGASGAVTGAGLVPPTF
jgi:HK97 family phage major capsid protein